MSLHVSQLKHPAHASHEANTILSFLWADSGRSHIKISKGMFLRLMTYHQVMAPFLSFVSLFGLRITPKELRFSGFREQTLFDEQCGLIHGLGRSGRHFQLSYNLKSIIRTSPPTKKRERHTWSIRQSAIHHQFDIVYGTTLWIMVKGNLELQQRIKKMTGPQGRPEDKSFETVENCLRSSLVVHLLCAQLSNEDWRQYVQWLEDMVDLHVSTRPSIAAKADLTSF
jgi:hypothetical protein